MNTSLIFLLLSCSSHFLIIVAIFNRLRANSQHMVLDIDPRHHKGSLNHDCVASVSIMIMLAVSSGNIKYVLWGYSFLSGDVSLQSCQCYNEHFGENMSCRTRHKFEVFSQRTELKIFWKKSSKLIWKIGLYLHLLFINIRCITDRLGLGTQMFHWNKTI